MQSLEEHEPHLQRHAARRTPRRHLGEEQAQHPNGACVEVARLREGAIAVRNSRFPSGPALVYTRAEIEAFLAGAKDGEFDHVLF